MHQLVHHTFSIIIITRDLTRYCTDWPITITLYLFLRLPSRTTFPFLYFVYIMTGLQTYHSRWYIPWKKEQTQLACSCSLCSEERGRLLQNKCAMWEKKQMQQIWRCCGLYTAGNRYFWSLHWRTNYTQVTDKLGVTLSNFYPIVCVHTSWLSYQYVFVFAWQKHVYALADSVCACVLGLCWPVWFRVNQSCWISVSQWSHLPQCSCE